MNRSQDLVFGSAQVDVISVCASWWSKRVRQGVHVLNPSESMLEYASELSKRLGTNTVYAYYTHLNKVKL